MTATRNTSTTGQCATILRRVDQHADRHEEDGREDIAHGLHQMLDRLFDAGFGDERAGQKRAERDRVAERRRQQRETERESDAGDDRRLRPIEPHDGADQPRHGEQADDDRRRPRNAASRPAVRADFQRRQLFAGESVVRIVISRIAIRSSTIRMPNTMCVKSPLIRCSSNALTMIVVLEMAMTAPA